MATKTKVASKRNQLIELMSQMTISDFKSKDEFEKVYNLHIELKGEPRKRERKPRAAVKIAKTEPETVGV